MPKSESGKPKTFKDYPEARGDLIERIGEYCSYCEMRLGASLAVGHILLQKHHPRLALRWDNFLLSCVNCNSAKGDKNIKRKHYYFPDRDNTARAFEYLEGGIVCVNPKLTAAQQARAIHRCFSRHLPKVLQQQGRESASPRRRIVMNRNGISENAR